MNTRARREKEPGCFFDIIKRLFILFVLFLLLAFLYFYFQGPSFLPSWPNPKNDIPITTPNTPGKSTLSHFGYDLTGKNASLKNEMLQGVFYDIKQTKDRKTVPDFENDSKLLYDTARVNKFLKVMTPFARGKWGKQYNAKGEVHYPELDRFYVSPKRLWNSYFLIDQKIEAKDAPEAFHCGQEVEQSSWVCIYSGVVKAPFTGKFRFLGFCDDALIVRFNGRIVLDHGWYNYISKDYTVGTYPTKISDSAGLGQGLPVDVKKGNLYPIEIMFSEIPGGHFTLGLFFEMLNSTGKPLHPDAKKYPLFRTTSDLPDQPKRLFPDYDPKGPIWKVVDSIGQSRRQK